jgi:hypothetical protein
MDHRQLTIRYDDELAEHIERLSRQEGISRNQAVLRLVRKGAGLEPPPSADNVIGSSLDWFIGSWTDEHARELEEATADFETIDEELCQ